MREISIGGSNHGGTTKSYAGWNSDLGSVMYETAYDAFWAGTDKGFLPRGPT